MTRLLVLGMLDAQPMSGYDIQQMLKLTNAERWGGVLVGSIYHALNKLEQDKHIEIMNIEQTGHRQKAVYQITGQGKEHLKDLISKSLQSSSVLYPTTLYSGLSFIHAVSAEQARLALERQQGLLEDEYQSLLQGQKEKEAAIQGQSHAQAQLTQDQIDPLAQLTFENMFAIIALQKEFVNKIVDLLKKQNE